MFFRMQERISCKTAFVTGAVGFYFPDVLKQIPGAVVLSCI